MPLDPGLRPLLDVVNAVETDPASRTVEAMRDSYRLLLAHAAGEPQVAKVEDHVIAGEVDQMTLRVYTPEAPGPYGVLVWFHGGGWTIGDLDTADATCRKLCARSGHVVVSVDYRRAPEHPYPAALEDAWVAVEWVAANGAVIGVLTDRLAVGGDSAGGNLAALVAIQARDLGRPAIALQLLVYPSVDLASEHPSISENAEGYILTADIMRWFRQQYLGPSDEHGDPASPTVSPLHADLRGLAPARVITAGYDPLRDEGDAYAARLAQAGVPVTHDPNPELTHLFMEFDALSPAAAAALDRAAAHLAEALKPVY